MNLEVAAGALKRSNTLKISDLADVEMLTAYILFLFKLNIFKLKTVHSKGVKGVPRCTESTLHENRYNTINKNSFFTHIGQ